MPKVIEELRKKIIEVTKDELNLVGYSNLKLRNIAHYCGVAVGTLYNYFPSKEALIGSIISLDWMSVKEEAYDKVSKAKSIDQVLEIIYQLIIQFYNKNKKIFDSYSSSTQSFKSNYESYHKMLRSQIGSLLEKGLKNNGIEIGSEELKIISEVILSCSMQNDIDHEVMLKKVKLLIEGEKHE